MNNKQTIIRVLGLALGILGISACSADDTTSNNSAAGVDAAPSDPQADAMPSVDATDIDSLPYSGHFAMNFDSRGGFRHSEFKFWSEANPGEGVPEYPGEAEDFPVSEDKFYIGHIPFGPYEQTWVEVGPAVSATADNRTFDLEYRPEHGFYDIFIDDEVPVTPGPLTASYLIPASENQEEVRWDDALTLAFSPTLASEVTTVPFGEDMPITWNGPDNALVNISTFSAIAGEAGVEVSLTCSGYLLNDGEFSIPAACLPEASENLLGFGIDVGFSAAKYVEFNDRRISLSLRHTVGLRISAPASEEALIVAPQVMSKDGLGSQFTKGPRWQQ